MIFKVYLRIYIDTKEFNGRCSTILVDISQTFGIIRVIVSKLSPRRYAHAYGICTPFYCISLKRYMAEGITLLGIQFQGILPFYFINKKIVQNWGKFSFNALIFDLKNIY